MNKTKLSAIRHHSLKAGAALFAMSACFSFSSSVNAQDASFTLEEIIVTAEKRSENLQETAIAISAVTSDDIRNQNIESLLDIGSFVPNVLVGSQSLTGANSGGFFIRGIGQDRSGITFDQGVGLYVDGVFVSRSDNSILSVLDVERIEVLRGPQGTLFGKNTIGGAIQYITKKPTEEFGGYVDATVGSFDRLDIKAAVNIPLSEKFFAKVTVGSMEKDGYIEHIADNRPDGNDNTQVGRLQLRALVSDTITVDLTASKTNSKNNGRAYIVDFIDPNDLFIRVHNTKTGETYDESFVSPDNYTRYGGDESGYEYDGFSLSGVITADLSEDLTLKSISSYMEADIRSANDWDGTSFNVYDIVNNRAIDQFSQELQLGGTIGDLQFVTGLYYLKETPTDAAEVTTAFDSTYPVPRSVRTRQNVESYAAFAQGTYNVTEQFSITAGMRYSKDATENGKGLVFSNPHFPWYSSERQYAMHLTVGDEYDAIGSTLLGLPVPLAGWNQSMAWSITYHTDQRFAIYELDLDASDPTKYIVDGETKSMVAVPVTIDVLQSDGKIMPVEHVFYETEFGVVLSAGPFLWSQEHAYAVMDFSIGNNRMMDQYLAIGRAKNVREVKAAQDKYLGLQFSNLGAADANGEAYYSNMAVSADYADEKLDQCFAGEAAKGFFVSFGSLLLKGTKACLPDNDPSAPQANIIPANRRPYIFRDDYVLNTNASHWIVNADPKSYLGGFNKTIGNENTARGERTRAAIKMVEDRLNGTDGLPGNKMTTDHLLELFYRGQNRTAELVVDDLVESCSKDPIVKAEGVTVDLAEACEILSKWDRRNHVDSVGAIIFEVFTQLLPSKFAVDYLPQDQFWKTPYDPADPLGTPRGFKVTSVVREALARAVYMLATYGVALDAPYGSVHGSSDKNGKHYGLPGGARLFHNIRITPEKGKGLTGPVTNGNSYMHMVSFDEEGPQAKFVLAYSQATDKKSANYMDQLPVYGSGQWMDMPFTEKQLEKQGYKLVRISQ